MFLPVLMLQRYGWAGFWVFFVPNVLGCSAMGYCLRRRGGPVSMAPAHQTAGRWFSLVTVAYHVFFVAYLTTELVPQAYPAIAMVAVLLAGWGLSTLKGRAWLGLAGCTYAVSIGVFVVLLGQENWPGTVLERGAWSVERGEWGARPLTDLIWLAPITAFGFSLCPYLDLTLRRAAAEAPSPHAFAVFGLAFAVMLFMTCVLWLDGPGGIGPWAWVHLLLQSVFTIGAHLREIRLSPSHRRLRRWPVMALPLLAGIGYLLARVALPGQDLGQTTYLRFLGCYGLVFPLYVWMFMGLPGRTASQRPALIWYAIAVVLLAPFYEAGFNQNRAWLLVVPMLAYALWGVGRLRRLTTGEKLGNPC